MLINPISDLHLNRPCIINRLNTDLAILAGDIAETPEKAMLFGRKSVPNSEYIIQISGNHDLIGYDMEHGLNVIKSQQTEKHIFLEDNVWFHPEKKLRVIGSTLWTDLAACGSSERFIECFQNEINDFFRIKNFSPEKWLKKHEDSKLFILNCLETYFDGATIIVNHHLTGPESVHELWKTHHLTSAFVSNSLDEIYTHPKCSMIVHGHTHNSALWRFDNTSPLIVCNPMGGSSYHTDFPKPTNGEFSPDLIVHIDEKNYRAELYN